MMETVALIGFVSLTAAVAVGWRTMYLRGLALDRLDARPTWTDLPPGRAGLADAGPGQMGMVQVGATQVGADQVGTAQLGASPLARPLRWLPWILTVPLGVLFYLAVELPAPYSVSLAVIAGLLGAQLEGLLAARKAALLETQLADAVDMMVGALGAGAGVAGALESAIHETSAPLRGPLEDVLGRIRLGDQPQSVFRNLAQRIPLETFLLFASALTVSWEVGGSLAPTLATVGRTIRDRIDVARRIRSNSAQSQVSTWMVLALTYFIALIVYHNGPEQMREFLSTSIGSFFVAGSMLLQAAGIVWMSYLSRLKF